jgi:flagellar hook assembly protein FlgD
MVSFLAAPAYGDTSSTTTSSTTTTGVAAADIATPALTPVTVPIITAPSDAATVSGDVDVTATSGAPNVQFYLDGVAFGTPVAVTSGAATTKWQSWGSPNGSHIWTAADCDTACNSTQSSPVTVTLTNTSPTVTAPTNGATTSTSVTLQASASGGGLAFFVDGSQVDFDGTTPYAVAVSSLAAGAHTTYVQACDDSNTACDGLTSSTVNFTVKILHPTITSVSPNPFSPHHDTRRDYTSFRIHLPDTEHVIFSIRGPHGTVVSGPRSPGTLAAGDHTYRWDGKNNSAQIVGDGTYTNDDETTQPSGSYTLHGSATATVRVDDTPPILSNITGNGSTFYPVTDGYKDKFSTKVTVNEGGRLWLEIYNSAGTKVRELATTHAAPGTFTISWNGRTAGGSLLPAGTYRYFFKAEDPAGNRRNSGSYHVTLRHEHLVNRAAVLTRNGDAYSSLDLSDSCTGASTSQSSFAHGLWLVNVCDESFDGFQVAAAEYTVTAPSAIRYNSIHIRSYGNTVSAPEIAAAIIYNWSTGWKSFGGALVNQNNVNVWTGYGTKAAAGYVSGSRLIRIGIGIGDDNPPEDYDIGRVEITVSYSVLHA